MLSPAFRFLCPAAGLAVLFLLVRLHAFTLGRRVTAAGLSAYAAAVAAALFLAAGLGNLLARRRNNSPDDADGVPSPSVSPFLSLLAGILLFGSIATAWQTHTDSFFQPGWCLPPRGGFSAALLNPALFLPGLAALFAFLRAWRGPRGLRFLRGLFPVALLLSSSVALFRLARLTRSLAFWNDDHASFLFRFLECAAVFPHFASYVPFWNGGVENSVIVTSGIRGLWLPFLPVWHLLGPLRAQFLVYGGLFFLLVPAATRAAGRRAGLDRTGATLFAGLVLWSSATFFGWTFETGTAGATAAAMWLPASLASALALASGRDASRGTLALWGATTFLVAQWPPMAGFLLVEALFVLWHLPRLDRRDRWRIFAVSALLLLLLLPTARAVLRSKSVLAYALSAPPAAASAATRTSLAALPAKAWEQFLFLTRNLAKSASPVLVFCGICGLFAATPRPARRLAVSSIAAGIALYAGAWAWKANLQTYRLVIPSFLVLAFPAAHFALAVLRAPAPSGRFRPLPQAVLAGLAAALILGACLEGPTIAARAARKGIGARDDVLRAAERLRALVPEGGRVLFAGKAAHAFGGGHLAPLPWLAGREMFACDYYGFPPGTAPNDCPPKDRRPPGKNGDWEYMRLHGVTHCIAHDPKKIASFRNRPDKFREVETLKIAACPDEVVFEVLGAEGGALAKGRGKVRATFNRIDVAPEPGERELVLRYAWSDWLSVPSPARIAPAPQENGDTFIALEPGGLAHVPIRYRPGF